MGILYNRFTPEPSPTSWTLIKKFTEVDTLVTIGDLTGKTELLVVCNDIVSVLFCIRDIGSANPFVEQGNIEKIYTDATGTGYVFEIHYRPYYTPLQSPTIRIHGHYWTSSSEESGSDLDSVNTKVFAR